MLKKATVKLIEEKFKKEFDEISYKIYSNKRQIKTLAEEQRKLKDTRKGLFEILSMIRGEK